jgi:hypothetical protein
VTCQLPSRSARDSFLPSHRDCAEASLYVSPVEEWGTAAASGNIKPSTAKSASRWLLFRHAVFALMTVTCGCGLEETPEIAAFWSSMEWNACFLLGGTMSLDAACEARLRVAIRCALYIKWSVM